MIENKKIYKSFHYYDDEDDEDDDYFNESNNSGNMYLHLILGILGFIVFCFSMFTVIMPIF